MGGRKSLPDCTMCGVLLTEKNRATQSYGRVYNHCRSCHIDYRIADQRRRRGEKRAFIRAQKDRPCMDCGGRFPAEAMDFDHRPGETKGFTVAQGQDRTEQRILEEIRRCDLVCANCHRVRTKQRLEQSRGE